MDINLLSITPDAETIIAIAARNSTLSKAHGEENNAKLIRSCIRRGHLSVLRHAYATFSIQNISRVCSHQLVTHVFLSRTQESQRRVKVPKIYAIPHEYSLNTDIEGMYHYGMTFMHNLYERLIEKGLTKEAARYCLPQGFVTSMTATANMEEWRKIIKDRAFNPQADWEIREVTRKIYDILKNLCPNVFYDFEEKRELKEGYIENKEILKQVNLDFKYVNGENV